MVKFKVKFPHNKFQFLSGLRCPNTNISGLVFFFFPQLLAKILYEAANEGYDLEKDKVYAVLNVKDDTTDTTPSSATTPGQSD